MSHKADGNGITAEPVRDMWGNDLSESSSFGNIEESIIPPEELKSDFGEYENHTPKEDNYLLQPQENYDKIYMTNYSNDATSEDTKYNNLDAVSTFLTAASLIPGLDTITNLASIPIDLARGDFLPAGLSAIGALPIVGEFADAAKMGKMADKALDTAKTADKVIDSAKTITKISPEKLTPTHKLTLSKRQYADLVDNIQKNGITEPIKYIEHNGVKYVVDGHHRLQVAKQLKVKDIPVQKVSLPYKGYKTIGDVLWFD